MEFWALAGKENGIWGESSEISLYATIQYKEGFIIGHGI